MPDAPPQQPKPQSKPEPKKPVVIRPAGSGGFLQPEVAVGEQVLHYPNGNPRHDPVPGIVRAVGMNSIDITVFDPTGQFQLINGARHLKDPALKREAIARECGGWDFPVIVKWIKQHPSFQKFLEENRE